jgi:Fe2+ or Zn2+ uptake regulation protein
MTEQAKTRITKQRNVILEELMKTDSHPTADELYQIVRRRLPRVSLGTVYRNLQLLSNQGLIRTLTDTGGQMRFDGDTEDHYHVRCTSCGRMEDLPGKPEIKIERSHQAKNEYEITGFRLEIVGICPDCKK